MIVANGCPKSGTHALMALLQRMGLRRVPGLLEGRHSGRKLAFKAGAYRRGVSWTEARRLPDSFFVHGHVHAGHDVGWLRVITIFRDPRNVLVSYCRAQHSVHGQAVSLIDAIGNFFGAPFVQAYRGFLGWRGRALCLRYEDIPAGFAGDGAGLYEGAECNHNTSTGAPSDWREWWGGEVDAAWRAAGGPDLLRAAGYA